MDFGDDPVCDHEVDQYLKPMESGGISPFQFERISNPIAKNFTGGDDFVSSVKSVFLT